jgi:hypothetical protein
VVRGMVRRTAPEYLPAAHEELVQQLSQFPVATLRQIARGWGWPVKGAAKAEIAGQLADYMADEKRMSAALDKLSAREQDVLAWTIRLGGGSDIDRLAAGLAYPAERTIPKAEVVSALHSLVERGLLFVDEYQAYHYASIAQNWIPDLDPPWLRHKGPLGAVSPFSLANLNRDLHHLLASVEIDRPTVPAPPQPAAPALRNAVVSRGGETASSRPGLVNPETLDAWAYKTTEERNRARFLLRQMATGGLLRVVGTGSAQMRLDVDDNAQAAWEQLNPVDRLNRVSAWWLGLPDRSGAGYAPGWNELDLALQSVTQYQLRTGVWWGGMEQLNPAAYAARTWLFRLLMSLTPDAWFSLDAFARFIWRIKPDLLALNYDATARQWHQHDRPLPAREMSFDQWAATYGRLLHAFMVGPAAWLGFAEVGREAGEAVCFRRPGTIDLADIRRLPADLVQFPAGDTVILRSTWQASAIRPLLQRIAVQSARDRATTTYRLDPATFRRTLASGQGSQEIARLFAGSGLALPAAVQEKLADWERRAGNYLIQENLAAIEFGEDVTPAEAQAIAALGAGRVYQATPRCLVVLDSADVNDLVDELRRRGYSPQVLK